MREGVVLQIAGNRARIARDASSLLRPQRNALPVKPAPRRALPPSAHIAPWRLLAPFPFRFSPAPSPFFRFHQLFLLILRRRRRRCNHRRHARVLLRPRGALRRRPPHRHHPGPSGVLQPPPRLLGLDFLRRLGLQRRVRQHYQWCVRPFLAREGRSPTRARQATSTTWARRTRPPRSSRSSKTTRRS